MRKVPAVAVVLTCLALPAGAFGQATRTWVSGVGDDVNPCSRTAPCKTWAGAISKTAIGGEIDALDPGGFGAVTITKSMTIDGGGQAASILASATTGVAINIAPNASDPNRRVMLRNLSINGAGAGGTSTGINGVRIDSANAVTLDNVDVANFTQNGVDFTPTATNDMSLLLDNVRLLDNNLSGLNVAAANTTQKLNVFVRNSTISASRGPLGPPGASGIGVLADTGAHVWLTGTSIFDNAIGLKTFNRVGSGGATGIVDSFCDNAIGGNVDPGTPPTSVCPTPAPEINTVTVTTPAPAPVTVTKTVAAPVTCTVPELVGLTLATARRGLSAAHCALGTVKRKHSRSPQRGRVLTQKIAGGKSIRNGAKVGVTVGKR